MKKYASISLICAFVLSACYPGTPQMPDKAQASEPLQVIVGSQPMQVITGSVETSKPVYRVAAEVDAPFILKDGEKVVGFDYDLLEAIAAKQGFTLHYTTYPWANLFGVVEGGQADITAGGIYITPERQAKFDFSTPYLQTGISLWAHNSKNINNFAALRDKKIAVKVRTQAERHVKNLLGSDDKHLSIKETLWLAFKEGASENVDAVVGDTASLTYFNKKYPHPNMVLLSDPKLPTEQYGFMIRKNQPELMEKLNAGLKQVQEDGTLERLRKKWFEDV